MSIVINTEEELQNVLDQPELVIQIIFINPERHPNTEEKNEDFERIAASYGPDHYHHRFYKVYTDSGIYPGDALLYLHHHKRNFFDQYDIYLAVFQNRKVITLADIDGGDMLHGQ
ncbi:hypothetical protein BN7_2448 [Wickerhamomyces ciferrii]|uniref:Uncharacterized protein n=1 Tax=Wickerhamomyces ciferrii (strain ATCC 14091 / BCRC 22168 / CBS 111 / JCM 3599 / NBRC 0793 / NRRL Y-1031 F-60-10) TaxID=1206466 RepID=K0KL47_WICCF|nr:uncharacterized protein BN7_2448 [Wickerhamomyces ciferrii]CCH42902.1 hypothetical protein BN7_2448 [Wickerhamomyces ciferrii]